MTARRSGMRPLDDGPRRGPEPWRTIDGVQFCHWDRWLLRLSLEERDGLDSIEATFRARANKQPGTDEGAEAMIAQVRDLKRRLAALSTNAAAVLDAEERASDWLLDKASKRVWHDGPQRRTPAMLQTPRRVLEQRALRGAWSSFPVSPASFEEKLKAGFGTGIVEYRFTTLVARGLELEIHLEKVRAPSKPALLALYRAALTVIIEAMNRVDDSDGELAATFRTIERSYLEFVPGFLDHGEILRDLLEVCIWEDYGLFTALKPFVLQLRAEHAHRARRELDLIIGELEAEGLDYQRSKALALRPRG